MSQIKGQFDAGLIVALFEKDCAIVVAAITTEGKKAYLTEFNEPFFANENGYASFSYSKILAVAFEDESSASNYVDKTKLARPDLVDVYVEVWTLTEERKS